MNTAISGPSFAEELTLMPVGFQGEPLVPEGYYLTNNDWLFGSAARIAVRHRPTPPEATTSVYLTVGNGGFESMSRLLPDEVAFLHVDHDPRVLFANQIAHQSIMQSAKRSEFYEAIGGIASGYQPGSSEAQTWQEKYLYQRERWSVVGRFMPWLSAHFLASERSFQNAKRSLQGRAIAYFAMDIFNQEHRLILASKLARAAAEVGILNVTNVFDPYYNRQNAKVDEVIEDLPVAEGLVVLQSTNKKRTRVGLKGAPYQRFGADVRVDRSVCLRK